jgi:hypothetical protein
VTADYLRQQAATCMLWSRDCFDLASARRLRLMAEEFLAKAAELEAAQHRENPLGPTLTPPHLAALQTAGDAS